MNYCFQVNGGGLFSRLLQCAIIPLADVDFQTLYLTAYPLPQMDQVEAHVKSGIQYVHDTVSLLKENGVKNPWDNIFNFILEQQKDKTLDFGLLPVGKFYDHNQPIELSKRYLDYKQIYSKLKIKSWITQQAQHRVDSDRILGVHVRIKDANSVTDPQQFENYVRAIDINLRNYNYSKIFVAADNSISISKLQERYPGMIICNDLARSDNETADSFTWEYHNYFRRHYWTDAMIDCLSLSRCNTLICKNSNFSNAAIVFGNFQYIHRLSE